MSNNTAIVVIDDHDRIFALNATAEYFLGCNDVRLLGQKITVALKKFPDLLRLYKGKEQFGEFIAFDKGKEKNYEVHLSPLAEKQSRSLDRVMLICDITEREHARILLIQRQQSLAAIKEREWLARELHDNLCQVLGFICVQAQAIHQALVTDQKVTAIKYLERLTAVAQEAQTEIREFIFNVKTTAVFERAFFPALEQYLNHFSQNYGIPVELVTKGVDDKNLLPDVRIQLPRIIQEALNNVRKHAHARHVRVVITSPDEKAICVTIEDDGCGFDPGISAIRGKKERPGKKEGFGLQIMAERAKDAGCTLYIDSEPGRGTRVTVLIPVQKDG